jgi:branched-chain amino acid transport system permease protein
MIILGGIGNLWGVVFGGAVLGFYDRILTSDLTNWLHQIGATVNIPIVSNVLLALDLSAYKYGIFGVALVVLMLTRPEGIFPNRQRAVEIRGETAEEVEQLSEEGLSERTVGGVRA